MGAPKYTEHPTLSQDWQTVLSSRCSVSRQSAVLPSKLPSLQPLPPPHVSASPPYSSAGLSPPYSSVGLTPPYTALTGWIRQLLAQNQLTLAAIRSLGQQPRQVKADTATLQRKHRVEAVVHPQLKLEQPSLEALDRRIMQEFKKKQQEEAPETPPTPVSLKDPASGEYAESNPFGFIRYIDPPPNNELLDSSLEQEYDEQEMSSLLPRSLLDSCPSLLSLASKGEDQSAPWGRRLPPLHGSPPAPLRVTSDCPVQRPEKRALPPPRGHHSAPALNQRRKAAQRAPRKEVRDESPPDWISCFPKSPKPRRKAEVEGRKAAIPEDAYRKAPQAQRAPPLKYIDKTPSGDSLQLPYGPPVKLDYEDFSNSEVFRLRAAAGYASPQLPRRNKAVERPHSRIRSRSCSQLAVIPVEDAALLPRPSHTTELVAQVSAYPRRQEVRLAPVCTCDSRRSSDSGLADTVTCHSSHCPLGRSLQSVSSLGGAARPPPPARHCSCGAPLPPCSQYPPHYPGQQYPALHSLSLDQLPTSAPPPPQDPTAALSCGDLREPEQRQSEGNRWSKTKETYKTGLYAHWWLNASLQPISEEPGLSTQL